MGAKQNQLTQDIENMQEVQALVNLCNRHADEQKALCEQQANEMEAAIAKCQKMVPNLDAPIREALTDLLESMKAFVVSKHKVADSG